MEQVESEPKAPQDPVPSPGPGFVVPMPRGKRGCLGVRIERVKGVGIV